MDRPERFECARCADCCRWEGNVLLTERDVSRLAAALEIGVRDFIDRYTRLAGNRAQLSLTEKENGECVLLDGSRCSLYEARPEQCREYPHRWNTEVECRGFEEKPKSGHGDRTS